MRPIPPLMLFAAGLGARMAPLTNARPKPLVEVAGKPLIEHALDLVAEPRPSKIVVNTHYKAEMLKRHLQNRQVETVFEPELLDTGGGLKNALPLLDSETVFTMNTDNVWLGGNPLPRLLEAWRPESMDALLLLIPRGDAIGHAGSGDFALEADGRLRRAPELVYSGLQMMKCGPVADVEENAFSLNRVWNQIGAESRLFGLVYSGSWCDVGRPENIALAEAMLARAIV